MLNDIFRQTVKPLQPEHVRELKRITDAIDWNQEQFQAHLQTIHGLELNQLALTRAQGRYRHQVPDNDFAHTHLCRALRMQQEAETFRLNNLVEMHETIITVLTDDLERFLECNYSIKREQGWHLDLQQRVLYKRPVLKKSKQEADTEGMVAIAESEPASENETP